MSRSPKVLIISPYPVTPPDTGARIRVFELADGLTRCGAQVTVLVPMSPQGFYKSDLFRFKLKTVPYPFVLPYFLTDKPFSYMYLVSLHPGFRFFVQKYFEKFDIIQFEQASFGDLAEYVPRNKRVIYDAHNVEYFYTMAESHRLYLRHLTSRRIFHLEKKLARRADRVLTCSAKDRTDLARLYQIPKEKCSVIANGIHLGSKASSVANSVKTRFPRLLHFPQRAIFSGSDVAHNRAAVRFLIESVAPRLRRECAFVFQGTCANSFKTNNAQNLFFDSVPGDVGAYRGICTVALHPITTGSGTSLKVLDYLAHGFPVISTEFGMRGYENLKRFVVLTELNQFVETLKGEYLLDSKIAPLLDSYSWTSVCRKLFDILLKLD